MRVPPPARRTATAGRSRRTSLPARTVALLSSATVALLGLSPAALAAPAGDRDGNGQPASVTATGAITTAAADTTDGTTSFTSATLAGSLQSELGCGADWDPACTATALTQDGDAFTGTFDVPAGDWEFKVAMNGAWDTSFGAGADGANVPLKLPAPMTLTFSLDPTTGAITLTSKDTADSYSGRGTPADAAIVTPAARAATGGENFYFVMADRFANGEPANDTGGIEGGRLEHGFDPTNKGFYNGGDLRGVIDQLDYIESLGTTAIWLTPSFTNQPVQGTGADASAGYHGYWVTDFTQIDPHLGGNAAMRELTDAAHARGIDVYMDIITNHTADVIDYAEGQYSYVESVDQPWVATDGTAYDAAALSAAARRAATDPASFPQFDETGFPYTPVRRAGAPTLVPEWLNDVTKYHNRGDSTWQGESVLHGDFVGLDDLMTEDPQVVDGFAEVYQAWQDFGVDGFRIDTAKHVNFEFWEQWTAALDDHALASPAARDDFFTFGEVYDADARLLAPYSRETGMDATLDFAFQSAAVTFAKGGSAASLQRFFATDDYYTTPETSAAMQPTFLGNHDMGRVGFFLTGAGDELARSGLAHDLMYLTRGQPVVYYGDEQGMAGAGGDKDARQSMFSSQVPDYQNQNLLDGTPIGQRDLFDAGAPLAQRLGTLAQLRETYSALTTGAQIPLPVSDEAVLALSRVDAGERIEHVVVQNSSAQARTVTVDALTAGARFTPVYVADGERLTGTEAQGNWLTAEADGALTVEVPALGSLVLRADREVLLASDVDGFAPPALRVGQAPTSGAGAGLTPIEADVPGDAWSPVSFAVREAGTQEWTQLGTDDGPAASSEAGATSGAARVFHDTSDVAPGTLPEYRAVARSGSDPSGLAVGEDVAAASTLVVAGVDLSGTSGEQPGQGDQLVTVPGSHNAAMGCGGDWQPDCDAAALRLDASGMYVGEFDLPAGSYEYKVAVGGSWDVNYGRGGVANGENIAYSHAGGPITFVYDPIAHQVTTTADDPLMTLPGSFNAAVGCAADWAPDCLATLLMDGDGDGIATWTSDRIPTGAHEVKVAHGLTWDENYGAGGARDGANIAFTATEGKAVTFRYEIATNQLTIDVTDPALPGVGQFQAHWLGEDLLAVPATLGSAEAGATWELALAPAGGIALTGGELTARGVAAGDVQTLALSVEAGGLPADAATRDPHLANYTALRLTEPIDRADLERALTGQVTVLQRAADGTPSALTGVQSARVLDDLYGAARASDLGPTFGAAPALRVWAPTATNVDALLWDDAVAPVEGEPQRVAMTRGADGTWAASGDANWADRAYLYEVTVYAPTEDAVVTNRVTDPYSTGLTLNSTHSVLTDLADDAYRPQAWATTPAPRTQRAVDKSIYELHVRDFSATDESVPVELRGTYAAFGLEGTAGTDHLEALEEAGLTSVHLLPTFDIATIEEDRSAQATADIPEGAGPGFPAGSEFGPDGTGQQAAVNEIKDQDAFNWGYDPLHYGAPEGSYASPGNQDGGKRVAQFRDMVGALHGMGLEVILDQVFNHTAASGQDELSVLDKIVPGYYHRLSATGQVETSTCCQNVATENAMAEELMVDSVVRWARDYKVDGFRFDLMGHHSKANMLAVRQALDELTLEKDGVDGASIYLYGEGWNFGEVANGARFEQATQGNLGGTGIGTFSDRMRDAVHGGSPVDGSTWFQQGFGTGVYVDNNGRGFFSSREAELADAQHQADLVRLGLAGNLRDYSFLASSGEVLRGEQLDYRGSPAGYAEAPEEIVSYVDAHDNETLFDLLTIKMPADATMDDKVRMNTLSLATVALSQTPAFWHAGTDLLRSKSLDRDSYNSGDWFNQIDWSGQESTFGVGLPPAEKNAEKWDAMRPLLADPTNRPGPQDMARSTQRAQDLLRLRYSTPLIRLGSSALIEQKVTFPGSGPGATPGVVTMLIDDTTGTDLDPQLDGLLVVFNATPEATTQTVASMAGADAALSPVQADGADEVVKATTFDAATGAVTVPARTVAVLEIGRTGEGPGEPGTEDNVFLTNSSQNYDAAVDAAFGIDVPAGADVLRGDWDGDGVDTLAWREGNRWTFASSNEDGGGELSTMWYGKPSDEPFAGDFDGDGRDTVGIRRGNVMHLRDDLAGGNATATFAYGKPSDELVGAGDVDGDGIDTLAVRRGNLLHVRTSLTAGNADVVVAYGKPSDQVLLADVDGDGRDDMVARRGTQFHLRDSLTQGNASTVLEFGAASDVALMGDWDGNGTDTAGVFRPAGAA